jgi:hypothetical protein
MLREPLTAVVLPTGLLHTTSPTRNVDPSPAGRAHHRADVATMARVYADVNQNMPRSYWDYDSVNIGQYCPPWAMKSAKRADITDLSQAGASWKTTRS